MDELGGKQISINEKENACPISIFMIDHHLEKYMSYRLGGWTEKQGEGLATDLLENESPLFPYRHSCPGAIQWQSVSIGH